MDLILLGWVGTQAKHISPSQGHDKMKDEFAGVCVLPLLCVFIHSFQVHCLREEHLWGKSLCVHSSLHNMEWYAFL